MFRSQERNQIAVSAFLLQDVQLVLERKGIIKMENNVPLSDKQFIPNVAKRRRPKYKANAMTLRGYIFMACGFILLLMGLLAATLWGNYRLQAEINTYNHAVTIETTK